MALPFRYDITTHGPMLRTLTYDQAGVWVCLVVALWNAPGPLPEGIVHQIEQESERFGGSVKRTLYPPLANRTESERFMLEEVAEGRWSFGWLEEHRSKQAEKSQKAQASGKSGGRGNTHHRKKARAKANALPPAQSERFTGEEQPPKANALQAPEPGEKRTLSEAVNEAKSERFTEDPEGARAPVRTRVLSSLFHEGGIEEEESERAKKKGKDHANDEPEHKSTFSNSDVATLEAFKVHVAKEIELGIDVDHYFHAVRDWSAIQGRRKLRTAQGWVATARTFMRGDAGKNGMRMVNAAGDTADRNRRAFEYLKAGRER